MKEKSNHSKNEKFDIPKYQVHIASQSYSNIASVLAGFALTIILLFFDLSRSVLDFNLAEDIKIATLIAMELSIAFIGCVIFSIVFATISGEDKTTSRSYTLAFLGGVGFVITVNLFIVALASILNLNILFENNFVIKIIFFVTMIISPLFALLSPIDIYIEKKKDHKPILSKILMHYFSIMIPFFIIKIISFFKWKLFFSNFFGNNIYTYFTLLLSFSIILLSSITSLFISTGKDEEFALSDNIILFFTVSTAVMISLLITLIK